MAAAISCIQEYCWQKSTAQKRDGRVCGSSAHAKANQTHSDGSLQLACIAFQSHVLQARYTLKKTSAILFRYPRGVEHQLTGSWVKGASSVWDGFRALPVPGRTLQPRRAASFLSKPVSTSRAQGKGDELPAATAGKTADVGCNVRTFPDLTPADQSERCGVLWLRKAVFGPQQRSECHSLLGALS